MGERERLKITGTAWAIAVVITIIAAIVFFYVGKGEYQHVPTEGFVGAKACSECHEEQYRSWAQTRMANTFDVLKPGEKRAEKELVGLDPDADFTHEEECLTCHTTGYGMVGGFKSIEETPHQAGVGCEACHGAGGMYIGSVMNAEQPDFATAEAAAKGLVYPPTEDVCLKCHNDKSPFIGMDYSFDFSDRVDRGTHEHFELKYEHGAAGS